MTDSENSVPSDGPDESPSSGEEEAVLCFSCSVNAAVLDCDESTLPLCATCAALPRNSRGVNFHDDESLGSPDSGVPEDKC